MLDQSGAGLVAHPAQQAAQGPRLLRRLRPDFKTIADFRKNNGDGVAAACRAFVRFAVGRGLIKGRVVAVDGSRFSAVSSAKKRQKRGEVEVEIAAHEAESGRYLDDLARADAATDPEEIEAEKSRIRAAVEELHGRSSRNAARSRRRGQSRWW